MTRQFWNGKRVLLTGHTGFKGSWLSLCLQGMGSEVIGYSLPPPTDPSLFELANVGSSMKSVVGDVRDLEHLSKTVETCQPEIVIHMAAQALVRLSYKDPLETYSTNVIGTANLLEAVRRSQCVRAVIIVTSDKCYENRGWIWGYRESDAMGGWDPYSSSKACAELITSAYSNSYFHEADYRTHGVAIASVRAGNVIGGGDWSEDRLIPDIMKAFMARQTVLIRSPGAIRPWQHVMEPLNGYIMLAERLWEHGSKFAGAWNFGPREEDARPVSYVVRRLADLWGDGAHWELDGGYQPHEAATLKLDCSKSRSLLGFSQRLSLDRALEWVVEWYRGYYQKADMRRMTESEISRYSKL